MLDALLLHALSLPDAFPGAGGVEAQRGLQFRRDAAWNDLQNFASKVDGESIHE
jgi:hypothetical protein